MPEVILITDEKGRKYLVRPEEKMTEISGLGLISTSKLNDGLSTGVLMIGKRKLKVRKASIDDIISVIERKAQTLTAKDIALIIHHCDVKHGSIIVEGGAGSGALTIALLSKVIPKGRIVTYELREDFADVAKRNVRNASLLENWTLKIGDICKEIEEKNVDGFIVDIPNPWDCIETAEKALRIGGHFCAFVPNINQLEKTVQEMRKRKFEDVKSLETLQREMVVHEGGVRPSFDMLGHTGYLIFARRAA